MASIPPDLGTVVVTAAAGGEKARIEITPKIGGKKQIYTIRLSADGKNLSLDQETWKAITEKAIAILQENNQPLTSLKKANICPSAERIDIQKKASSETETIDKIIKSDTLKELNTTLQELAKRVDDVAKRTFPETKATADAHASATKTPDSKPAPAPAAAPTYFSIAKSAVTSAASGAINGLRSRIFGKTEATPPKLPEATANPKPAEDPPATKSQTEKTPAKEPAKTAKKPVTDQSKASTPVPGADKTAKVSSKIFNGEIGTVFVAKDGRSQHSEVYHQDTMIGEKINPGNKSKEAVYFPVAACTPLAIAFAASAQKGRFANGNTPREHLDKFLGKTKAQLGIAELRNIMREKPSEIALDRINLGNDDALRVYTAMADDGEKVKVKASRSGGKDMWEGGDTIHNEKDWYKNILTSLKPGEGAVVIIGDYSIGVRFVEAEGEFAYEIFDSHNSNSYTEKNGACVIQCSTRDKFKKALDTILNAQQGQEKTIEVTVYESAS